MSLNTRESWSKGKIVVASRRDPGPSCTCIHLVAPSPGIWRNFPVAGRIVQSGQAIGDFEVLGQRFVLVVPSNALGQVVATKAGELLGFGESDHGELKTNGAQLSRAVQYGEILITLDSTMIHGDASGESREAAENKGNSGLYVRSPSSGRFYSRPSPDRPAFVQVGDIVERGQTVAMLEVMKTFTRIQLGGDQVSDKVRVTAVFVQDEDELAAGDVILEYEAVDQGT